MLPALSTRVNEFSTKRHACYRAGSAKEVRLWARAAASPAQAGRHGVALSGPLRDTLAERVKVTQSTGKDSQTSGRGTPRRVGRCLD